ncbi:hypothetical protein [Actinoplanes friuliensis]|nr:hypothetical protein [Actinoplanes friuliensis]
MSKTVRILLTALVVLAGSAGAAVAWAGRPAGPQAPADRPVAAGTTPVVRTDLSSAESLPGTLGHGAARPLKGAREGLVTWLPAPGSTVTRGRQLYRVDDQPVPLFYGSLPLFRTLATENTTGRDVHVVATNLKALGYDIGTQPRTGATVVVREPAPPPGPADPAPGEPAVTPEPPVTHRIVVGKGEDVLTRTMVRAIRRWQRDTGLPVTGRIKVGDALVLSGAVRIDSLAVQLGDPAQAELMSVTSTAKVITVQAEAALARKIDKGDKVTVALPDDDAAAGTVTAVGTALRTQDGAPDAAAPNFTIAVTVDNPKKLSRLDSADVQVSFAGETHDAVLVVPVGALVALSEGGYAVQISGGALVAVETGMFAKGLVEVTGDGLAEGTNVVTTS